MCGGREQGRKEGKRVGGRIGGGGRKNLKGFEEKGEPGNQSSL